MISGTFIDAASGQGAFSGNIALTRFEVRQRSLVVIGTLTGILAESRGSVIGRVNEEVGLPVVVVSGTCQLLHLDVGPTPTTNSWACRCISRRPRSASPPGRVRTERSCARRRDF